MIIWQYGYGAGDLGDLIGGLKAQGIDELWDVREVNYSQRAEFCGDALRASVRSVLCQYWWMRDLGNPYRKSEYTWAGMADRLETLYLIPGTKAAYTMDLLRRSVVGGLRVCVMCACKSETRCHRHIVLKVLCRQIAGLEVRRLLPGAEQKQGTLFGE